MDNTESRNSQKKPYTANILSQRQSLLKAVCFQSVWGPWFPDQGWNPIPLQWKLGVLSTGLLEKSLRGRDLYRERAIEVKLACFSVDIANQCACYIQEENTLKTQSNKQNKQVIRVLALQIHKTLDRFLFKRLTGQKNQFLS